MTLRQARHAELVYKRANRQEERRRAAKPAAKSQDDAVTRGSLVRGVARGDVLDACHRRAAKREEENEHRHHVGVAQPPS